jgi:hypothetical protein
VRSFSNELLSVVAWLMHGFMGWARVRWLLIDSAGEIARHVPGMRAAAVAPQDTPSWPFA